MDVKAEGKTGAKYQAAFEKASSATGTSFDYLLHTAVRESSLQPQAKAAGSSAEGLFQFIESTWLETMGKHGAALGLERFAQHVSQRAGRFEVADPAKRSEILALRRDPEISALMAGALSRENAGMLARKLGREVGSDELYLAHFLGAQGALRFIRAAEDRPQMPAALLFQKEAKANPAVFFGEGGKPLSFAQIKTAVQGAFAASMDVQPMQLAAGEAVPVPNRKPIDGFPPHVAEVDATAPTISSAEPRQEPFTIRRSRIFTAYQSGGGVLGDLFRADVAGQKRQALNASYLTKLREDEQVQASLQQQQVQATPQEKPEVTSAGDAAQGTRGPLDLTAFLQLTRRG